jgi:hypothetical protein
VSHKACAVGGALAGLLVLLVAVSKRQPLLDKPRIIFFSVLWGFIAWGIFRLAAWIARGIKKRAEE